MTVDVRGLEASAAFRAYIARLRDRADIVFERSRAAASGQGLARPNRATTINTTAHDD